MSFEGYYQILCKNGHYHTVDVHASDWFYGYEDDWECHCGAKKAHENTVDQTNGCDEGEDHCPGYIEMELVSEDKCKHCDSILERTYKLPEAEKERRSNE